jgi:hypothetical protein
MIYLLVLPIFAFIGIKATLSLDPDFGWHLFLGQKMSESHALITKAIGYNYFQDLSIPDHEWLSDLILYQLYEKFGYWSLILITLLGCLILGLLIIKIVKTNARLATSRMIGCLTVATALFFTFDGIRVQYLLFLAVAIFILVKNVIKQFRMRLLLYFLLVAVGNNLHGGIITLLPVPFLLELDLSFLRKDYKKIIVKIFILVITLVLALMINPNNISYWQLIDSYATNSYYLFNIEEWLPIFSFPINIWYLTIMGLIIFFLTIDSYFKKIPRNELLLICFFSLLGIIFSRYFPIAVIVVLPAFVRSIDNFFITTRITKKTQSLFVFIPLFFIISAILINLRISRDAWSEPFNNDSYPKKAVAFMIENQTCQNSGNFLNPYDWGGYLVWANQKQKVFIDGRGPQTIAPESTNKSILEIRNDFESHNPKIIEENIIRYNISCAMVDTRRRSLHKFDFLNIWILKQKKLTENDMNKNYLLLYLENSENWEEVYRDEISVLFRKK